MRCTHMAMVYTVMVYSWLVFADPLSSFSAHNVPGSASLHTCS